MKVRCTVPEVTWISRDLSVNHQVLRRQVSICIEDREKILFNLFYFSPKGIPLLHPPFMAPTKKTRLTKKLNLRNWALNKKPNFVLPNLPPVPLFQQQTMTCKWTICSSSVLQRPHIVTSYVIAWLLLGFRAQHDGLENNIRKQQSTFKFVKPINLIQLALMHQTELSI